MAANFTDNLDPMGRLDAVVHDLARPANAETRPVVMLGVPAAAVHAVELYLTDLARELTIRRLDPARPERAKDELTENVLSTIDLMLAVFNPVPQQIAGGAMAAREEGLEVFDLVLELPPVAKKAALLFGDLLAHLALAATRAGLLTKPLREGPAEFVRWLLDSVMNQLSGEGPTRYAGPTAVADELPAASPERVGVQSQLLDALYDSRSFPLALDSPRAARHFVAERLREWGLDAHAERSTLPVSELVTNVVVHAHTQAVVQVMSARGRTRVGVRDFSNSQPVPRYPAPTAPFGRGLRIVDQSVSRWGVENGPTGKSVWFELDDNGA